MDYQTVILVEDAIQIVEAMLQGPTGPLCTHSWVKCRRVLSQCLLASPMWSHCCQSSRGLHEDASPNRQSRHRSNATAWWQAKRNALQRSVERPPKSISDALDYMTYLGLIAAGRKAEILTGVVK